MTIEQHFEDQLSTLLLEDYKHVRISDLYIVDHEYHDKKLPGFASFTLREFRDATYIEWTFLARAMVLLTGSNVVVGCYTGDEEGGSLRVTVEGIDVKILRKYYSKLMKREKECSTKARRVQRK